MIARRLAHTLPAMSTPLASIFGSGFLVIVPVLVSAVGPYAWLAASVVAAAAFLVGGVIRFNIAHAEALLQDGGRPWLSTIERLSDLALVAAYVVSVCLYVHILAAFALGGFALDSEFNKSLLTTIVIVGITVIGMTGGLAPLERLERWALGATLAILALLLLAFALHDAAQWLREGRLPLPAFPDRDPWEIATIVAGTLIIVQGFETTRYLGQSFDADTRIRAARWSQYLSLSVYIVFVALALPIASVLQGKYGDNSLIALAASVWGLLPLPLIVAACLSQFSAAVADTLAAAANMEEATHRRLRERWGYLWIGGAASVLAWSGSTFEIIALASRAFALYYLLQCLIAIAICRDGIQRLLFVFIALMLGFVLLFAVPAG